MTRVERLPLNCGKCGTNSVLTLSTAIRVIRVRCAKCGNEWCPIPDEPSGSKPSEKPPSEKPTGGKKK